MGRGIGPAWRSLAALSIGAWLAASVAAEELPSADTHAIEQFRAAAVLQQRALYDLAEAEYAAFERANSGDLLADRARLERGVCQFHLRRFADAAETLAPLLSKLDSLSPADAERSLAYCGLAQYNRSHAAAASNQPSQLDSAIATLAAQLAKFPAGEHAPLSAYYHAEALYARGRLEEASAAYRALLAKYPAHEHRADILYALGVADEERRAFAAAAEAFASLENEFPGHAAVADARARRGDSLLAVAESQLGAEEDQSADETVAQLLREFPESARVPPALAIRAQLQLRRFELPAAEATLDECIVRSTHAETTNPARLLRAQVRYRRGNFSGAYADATSALVADSRCVEALHLRGLAETGLGRPTVAVKTFTQLLSTDPNYTRADSVLYDLAWAYQAADRPQDATATFERLVAEYPKSRHAAEGHFRIGEAKFAAKDFSAAAKCFSQTCDTKPSPEMLPRAMHKLAWCSFERGEYAAAEATFSRQVAAQHGPIDELAADALSMIVECRFQQRQYEQALAAFDVAALHPSANGSLRAMAYVHAAKSAAKIQNWQRACDLADRAVRDFPNSNWQAEARCERGVALVELGRLDEAERDLSQAVVNHQGLLQLKSELALAKIMRARHNQDAAVRAYFKVAYGRGGPTAPVEYHLLQAEAIFAAAQVLEESGRHDAAGKLYQELVDQYPASAESQLARQSLERILRR